MAEPRIRDQKKARTRERILSAAERVFAEKGYTGAAVDDVAAAAGLTKGGVYAHFRSKEDLYMALVRRRGHRSLEEVQDILATEHDADSRAKALTKRLIDQISDRAAFILGEEFLIHASRNPRLRKQVREAATQARQVDADLIRSEWAALGVEPTIEAEDLSRLIAGVARELAWEAALNPKAQTAPAAERAIGFLIRAARESHSWR